MVSITMPAAAYADEENTLPLLQHSDVATYIAQSSNSDSSEDFGPELVTYYYGDGFIVVEDRNLDGYYLIEYNSERTEITVNGKSVLEHGSPLMRRGSTPPPAPGSGWTYFDTDEDSLSIGGVAASAVGKLIEVQLGPLSSKPVVDKILSELIDTTVEEMVNNCFPNAARLTLYQHRYTGHIDYVLGTYERYTIAQYYYGTNSNPDRDILWKNEWTQTIYS